MQKHNLDKNILLYSQNEYFQNEHVNNQKIDIEGMIIRINLKGRGQYRSLISDYAMQVKEEETILDLIKPDEGVTKIHDNTHQKFVSLIIPKDFLRNNIPLDKYTEKFHNTFEYGQNIKNLSHQKSNPRTQALALDILNSPFTNKLDKLYIESKVLEIIHTEFSSLFKVNEPNSPQIIKLSTQDKEAIYYANEILSQNMSNPPSIKELCRMAAINELKLKTGFRQYFNQTPYNISIEYRLQEAKKLLNESELNINEIAIKIGYKYVQSFSNAFIKRFGVRPKELMKSRNYYY